MVTIHCWKFFLAEIFKIWANYKNALPAMVGIYAVGLILLTWLVACNCFSPHTHTMSLRSGNCGNNTCWSDKRWLSILWKSSPQMYNATTHSSQVQGLPNMIATTVMTHWHHRYSKPWSALFACITLLSLHAMFWFVVHICCMLRLAPHAMPCICLV